MGSEIRIINGTSGAGKSMLLDHIALQTSTKWWIKRMDLKEFSPTLSKMIGCEEDSLSEDLLQYFSDRGKVMILIDGFDELQEQYVQEVLEMIKSFSELDFVVYVTTRPHCKHILENYFNTFALTLKRLTTSEQESYLQQYFTLHTSAPLPDIKKIVSLQKYQLLSVPLHIKMYADFFIANYENIKNTDNFLLDDLSLIYLCEYFVDENNKVMIKSDSDGCNNVHADYEYCRFLYAAKENLFLETEIIDNELRLKEKECPKILEMLKLDQVLVVENGIVSFVYRVFSEYIIARWLTKNLNKKLIKNLFNIKFVTIRRMFDQILAKDCPLHLAIINQQLKLAEQIITKDRNSIYKLDVRGRSVLHLICCWSTHRKDSSTNVSAGVCAEERKLEHYSMVNILKLLPKIKKCTRDKLLNYSELDYAILSKSYCVADELSAKIEVLMPSNIKNLNISGDIKKVLEENNMSAINIVLSSTKVDPEYLPKSHSKSLFCKEREYGNNKVEVMIEHGVDLLIPDEHGRTLLHYSIIYGDVHIIEDILYKLGNDLEKTASRPDLEGRTLLHYAACKGMSTVIEIFAINSVNITVKDNLDWTPLHFASFYGHANVVHLLLSYTKENINWVDQVNRTPLLLAAEKGYDSVIDILVDNGARVNAENLNHFTALCFAVLRNNAKLTVNLLNNGANLEHFAKHNLTPLLLAAYKGHTHIMKVLLNYNADISACDDKENSALILASENGHEETVMWLLDNGANVNDKNIFGMSALSTAILKRHTVIVKILVDRGVDVNARDGLGWTPLACASDVDLVDVVAVLLKNNAEINTPELLNLMSPLMLASRQNNSEVVKVLLDGGALINEQCEFRKSTALYYAVYDGQFETVKLLIENNANMHIKGKLATPLTMAIVKKRPKIVQLLLSHSTAWNVKDDNKYLILYEAAAAGDMDVTKFFLDSTEDLQCNEKMPPMIMAVNRGQNAILKLFLERGASANSSYHSLTSLHRAARNGHLLTVEVLLHYGADVNCEGRYGTPIFGAVLEGHTKIVRLLLTNGAKVDAVDGRGRTALTLAATLNNAEILMLLLDYNSDIEHNSRNGFTPLLCAAQCGLHLNIEILLNKGALINAKDNKNRTSIYHASFEGHTEAVKLLLDKKCELQHRCNRELTAMNVAKNNRHFEIYELLRNASSGQNNRTNWRDRNPDNTTGDNTSTSTRRIISSNRHSEASRNATSGQSSAIQSTQNTRTNWRDRNPDSITERNTSTNTRRILPSNWRVR